MVNRYVEEALNLVSMKIHGDNTVNTSYAQKVSHELCTDAYTWFVLTPVELSRLSTMVAIPLMMDSCMIMT